MILEKIMQRWIDEEGFSPARAREIALDEIDFYQEEAKAWKGNDDRMQEYI
jgi:hypothetical protein